jgi:hypothetical protein
MRIWFNREDLKTGLQRSNEVVQGVTRKTDWEFSSLFGGVYGKNVIGEFLTKRPNHLRKFLSSSCYPV